MDELPHIDELAITIDAPPRSVWTALGELLQRRRPAIRAVGRLLAVRPLEHRGDVLTEGATLTGFRVAHAAPEAVLALAGEHRFSRYGLTFRIDPLHGGRSRLRAETRAAFPGVRGTVYRGLVIGTRGHVLAVRLLLRDVRRRAERPASTTP